MPQTSRVRLVVSALLISCSGLAVVTPGAAQARTVDADAAHVRSLDTGTRVRVRMVRQAFQFAGAIATLRPDTIILTVPGTRLGHRAVAVSEIAELEVFNGTRRLTPAGLVIGALTGAGLTAAYNGIVQSQCFSNCPERVSAGIGALVGGVVVGGSLYFVKKERWVRIAVPGRRRPSG
ncbi:MAG: hypothetical protein WEE89_22500 [Gemmatimonadota bacterium]